MARTKVFAPSNLVIDSTANIYLNDCRIIKHNGWNMEYANVYWKEIKGDITLDNCDIYTEDDPVVFIDKLEHAIIGGGVLL